MTSYLPSGFQQPTNARKRSADDNSVHTKIDGLMAQAADATIANFLEWNEYRPTLHRSHHIVTYNVDKAPKTSGEHNEEWNDDTSSSSRSAYSLPTSLSKKRRMAEQRYPRESRNPYYVPSGKRRIIATRAA